MPLVEFSQDKTICIAGFILNFASISLCFTQLLFLHGFGQQYCFTAAQSLILSASVSLLR